MAPSRAIAATPLIPALLLTFAACGDDRDAKAEDHSVESGTSSAPVQFRRVLESSDAPTSTTDATPATTPLPRDCSGVPSRQPDATAEAVVCDDHDVAYRLAPAEVSGGVDDAKATSGPTGGWLVALELDDAATTGLAALTTSLVGTETRMAVVADGKVLVAPVVQSVITDGKLQLAGDFTRAEAERLAQAMESD